MSKVIGYDATTVGEPHIPAGKQSAGYTTGAGIAWTPEQFAAHPNAVRICQDAGATDTTADVLDVESGAATIADIPGWYHKAVSNFRAGVRPGQRYPTVYASLSNITPIVTALTKDGLHTEGDAPYLWVAHWGITEAQALADLTDQPPFNIVGYQFASAAEFDTDVFETDWLDKRSVAPAKLVGFKSGLVAVFSDGTTCIVEETAEHAP